LIALQRATQDLRSMFASSAIETLEIIQDSAFMNSQMILKRLNSSSAQLMLTEAVTSLRMFKEAFTRLLEWTGQLILSSKHFIFSMRQDMEKISVLMETITLKVLLMATKSKIR